MVPLVLEKPLRYSGIVGTGGIGSGKFFMLNGDDTLGREESRSGHFLDVKDYCKQHIILHYLSALLGPDCTIVPVGLIGDDEVGESLFQEMQSIGLVMDHVQRKEQTSTLFSFCFHYPNGGGGNMTTDNSASAKVDALYIDQSEHYIRSFGPRGMVMAAPEVSIQARHRLLELGKRYDAFCTASFTSEEVMLAADSGILNIVDLIALNIDEANALTGRKSVGNTLLSVEASVQALRKCNERMMISITAGIDGSWCWDGNKLQHLHAINAAVRSTAGAGDAFYAGLLTGLATGMTLHESQELASLVASMSVTSPHTINHDIDRKTLAAFSELTTLRWSYSLRRLLNLL